MSAVSTSPNGTRPDGTTSSADRPLVLLCECAGTMDNIDFDALERRLAPAADIVRGTHWCSRQGQAGLLEIMESESRRPVFAGCSRDFSDRRFHRLHARGLRLETADIREGCSWVHGGDTAAVTDKAARIVEAAAPEVGAASSAKVTS